jgi:hypothetical protein
MLSLDPRELVHNVPWLAEQSEERGVVAKRGKQLGPHGACGERARRDQVVHQRLPQPHPNAVRSVSAPSTSPGQAVTGRGGHLELIAALAL